VSALLFVVLLAAGPAVADGERPMAGPGGVDDDGAPRDVPDKLALQRLLRARRFDELDAWLVDLQQQFEDDPRKERWPSAGLAAFDVADPQLGPLLDAWVDAKPGSYMALAARGVYHNAAAWKERGGRWASETTPKQFRAMEAEHRTAFPDLAEALRLHPTLTEASRTLIEIGKANGRPKRELRQILDAALKRCPDCFNIRVTYILALRPRWSGSHSAMRAFAAESERASKNPRMRALAGFVDWDDCDALETSDPEASLAACDRALVAGEHWMFHDQRAQTLRRLKRTDEALAEANRADALSPENRDVLRTREWILENRRDYQGVARDTAVLKDVDPDRTRREGDARFAAQGLAADAGRARKAGHIGKAIALMKKSVAVDPDWFENFVRLDRMYWQTGQLAAAVALWTEYLGRHPQEGKARLERSGALWHLGRKEEALAEAGHACRLGEDEGCDLVRRHGDGR
jgi:tetratricopeptide (TPR) repeat protein